MLALLYVSPEHMSKCVAPSRYLYFNAGFHAQLIIGIAVLEAYLQCVAGTLDEEQLIFPGPAISSFWGENFGKGVCETYADGRYV